MAGSQKISRVRYQTRRSRVLSNLMPFLLDFPFGVAAPCCSLDSSHYEVVASLWFYCACLACVVIQLAIFNSVIRQHWSTSSSLADLEGVRILHFSVTCPFLTDDRSYCGYLINLSQSDVCVVPPPKGASLATPSIGGVVHARRMSTTSI